MLGDTETLTKVCGETAGRRDGVQSRWNKPTALHVHQNTVFVCDTGNKAVRILTSAKGLIPLQSNTAQYANVFPLDKKAKEEELPRTFEDHVKSVEELVAFLSNHEQEALERMGKRKTNGSNMTMPRCTRQSFLIMLESLTSFTNTLTEIEHCHLLGRICLESMTTFGRGMLFQRNASRPRLTNSGSLLLQKSVLRGIRYAAHLSKGFLILYWTQFILSGEKY